MVANDVKTLLNMKNKDYLKKKIIKFGKKNDLQQKINSKDVGFTFLL